MRSGRCRRRGARAACRPRRRRADRRRRARRPFAASPRADATARRRATMRRAHLEARRRGHPRRHRDPGLPSVGRAAGQGRRPAADPGGARPLRRREPGARPRPPHRARRADGRASRTSPPCRSSSPRRTRKPSPRGGAWRRQGLSHQAQLGRRGPANRLARQPARRRDAARHRHPPGPPRRPARPGRGPARSSSGSGTTRGSSRRSSLPCAGSSCSR